MTPTQQRVLEWLLAYPGVYVTARMNSDRVSWSAWWSSEAARENMVSTLAVLGSDLSSTASRAAPIPGATPHITRPTFAVLQRNGWLRMVKHWRGTASYTISRSGILAVRGLTAEVTP